MTSDLDSLLNLVLVETRELSGKTTEGLEDIDFADSTGDFIELDEEDDKSSTSFGIGADADNLLGNIILSYSSNSQQYERRKARAND